jgi:hypothetical protein
VLVGPVCTACAAQRTACTPQQPSTAKSCLAVAFRCYLHLLSTVSHPHMRTQSRSHHAPMVSSSSAAQAVLLPSGYLSHPEHKLSASTLKTRLPCLLSPTSSLMHKLDPTKPQSMCQHTPAPQINNAYCCPPPKLLLSCRSRRLRRLPARPSASQFQLAPLPATCPARPTLHTGTWAHPCTRSAAMQALHTWAALATTALFTPAQVRDGREDTDV